jgi:hypothetical protein
MPSDEAATIEGLEAAAAASHLLRRLLETMGFLAKNSTLAARAMLGLAVPAVGAKALLALPPAPAAAGVPPEQLLLEEVDGAGGCGWLGQDCRWWCLVGTRF